MEIEAKFAVPDVDTFQRLQAVEQIAGFSLSIGQVKQVHDTYLDTGDRLLLAARYACRRRERGDELLITLKGLGRAEGAVHRREELETSLPSDASSVEGLAVRPHEWPASLVRERVLQLVGEVPLAPLFDLRQTRVVRLVSQPVDQTDQDQEERLVAELSLDDVHLAVQGREQAYYEIEVELAPQGTEDDLAEIVACLRDEWDLQAEPRSKFERALTFSSEALESPSGEMPMEDRLLTPQERAVCQQVATREDMYARRARTLLALDEGVTQVEAGECAQLSDRRVRHWLAAFREKRLGVFPARVLAEVPPPQEPTQPQVQEPPQPVPLETLFDRYGVDRAHARTVADHALALFDHLLPSHGLPPERRALLETAALVHNVGLEADPGRHHIAGRNILLSHPPAGLDDCERQVVALTTFLHRKRTTSKRLDNLARTFFGDLPEPVQAETLALAALVRMADGLDYSQTGTSQLGEVRWPEATEPLSEAEGGGRIEIEVTGPYAAIDADRAQHKADLWRLLFETGVQFKAVPDTLTPALSLEGRGGDGALSLEGRGESEVLSLPDRPGLEADDSMAEAARKTLFFHFQRMRYHEPGTRLGEDIEELHDMRVATRRMRAALRVFGDYLDMDEMSPFVKGLRRTGRTLGAVRDLDVFWEKTQHYLDTLAPVQQDKLDPLREVWEAERERARDRMLAYLDSDRYSQFRERWGEFLQRPGAGALAVISKAGEPLPHCLRHVVPVAVYQRLAAVRAYDEWVTGPDVPLERLHQLRIAAKGLRYTLEFFREVLGPETRGVIDEIKGLQDHLGDLQDAVVASNLLRDFLTWGTWGHTQVEGRKVTLPTEPVVAPGVAAYLTARQVELQDLLDTFPQAWARVQGVEFGHMVAASLAVL